MNQKCFTSIIIAIIIVIFIVLVGCFFFIPKVENPITTQTIPPITERGELPEETDLTNEIALSLLKNYLPGGECRLEGVTEHYRSCVIDISKENNQWDVIITIDGLFDDSVRASQIKVSIVYRDGEWIKGEILRSQKCWPGRGHQDFSTELCI